MDVVYMYIYIYIGMFMYVCLSMKINISVRMCNMYVYVCLYTKIQAHNDLKQKHTNIETWLEGSRLTAKKDLSHLVTSIGNIGKGGSTGQFTEDLDILVNRVGVEGARSK